MEKERINKWRENRSKVIKGIYKNKLLSEYKNIMKHKIRYANPMLINYDFLSDVRRTYVLPIFLKPGRSHFFIRTKWDESWVQ